MDIQSLLKQATQMQAKVKQAQNDLKSMEFVGEVSNGLVSITANGDKEITSVKIDESVLDDKEMLEDLILTATNIALKQAKDKSEELMKGATGNLGMPDGLI